MVKNKLYQTAISFLFLIIVQSCTSKNKEIIKDENGNIVLKCELKNCVRHGKCYQYYSNGHILAITNWLNGIQDGERVEYFENGEKKEKSMWKDGKLEGECMLYFENGGIRETIYYIENQRRRHEFYDKESRLQKVYDFVTINNETLLNGHVVYDTDGNYPYNVNFSESQHAQIIVDSDTIDYCGFAEYEVQWVCSDKHYVRALTGNIDRNFNVVDSALLRNVDLDNKNKFYPSHLITDTLRILFDFMIKKEGELIIYHTFLEEVFKVREK